jgi:hypothetical protein
MVSKNRPAGGVTGRDGCAGGEGGVKIVPEGPSAAWSLPVGAVAGAVPQDGCSSDRR